MTKPQAQRLARKFSRIRELAEQAADIFQDDPLEGELYTAVNNITAACDWATEAVEKVLKVPA